MLSFLKITQFSFFLLTLAEQAIGDHNRFHNHALANNRDLPEGYGVLTIISYPSTTTQHSASNRSSKRRVQRYPGRMNLRGLSSRPRHLRRYAPNARVLTQHGILSMTVTDRTVGYTSSLEYGTPVPARSNDASDIRSLSDVFSTAEQSAGSSLGDTASAKSNLPGKFTVRTPFLDHGRRVTRLSSYSQEHEIGEDSDPNSEEHKTQSSVPQAYSVSSQDLSDSGVPSARDLAEEIRKLSSDADLEINTSSSNSSKSSSLLDNRHALPAILYDDSDNGKASEDYGLVIAYDEHKVKSLEVQKRDIIEETGSYRFTYKIEDKESTEIVNAASRVEERGKAVYMIVRPDGQKEIVEYAPHDETYEDSSSNYKGAELRIG